MTASPYSSVYACDIRAAGQPALLADERKARAEPIRDRASEDEPARLDPGHDVHVSVEIRRSERR